MYNTILVCSATITVGLAVNSIAGYALAKLQFKGKRMLFLFIVLTIMIPGEGITIPLYSIVHGIGLTNIIWALLLPMFVNGIVIFMFKQFFEDIPDSLLESARSTAARRWARLCASWFHSHGPR